MACSVFHCQLLRLEASVKKHTLFFSAVILQPAACLIHKAVSLSRLVRFIHGRIWIGLILGRNHTLLLTLIMPSIHLAVDIFESDDSIQQIDPILNFEVNGHFIIFRKKKKLQFSRYSNREGRYRNLTFLSRSLLQYHFYCKNSIILF